MEALKAVVFDLDGTLIDSSHDYREMARRVGALLEHEGVSPEDLGEGRRVWQIIRAGAESLAELGLEPDRIEKVLNLITRNLNEVEVETLPTVKPKPGAINLLKSIKDSGLKIGIATRSCREYALASMEKTGIMDYVDACLARDEVEHPKPDPRHLLEVLDILGVVHGEVIYVGDTTTDHQTALSAGIHFVGFPSSEVWRERMVNLGELTLVSCLEEIMGLGLW